MNYDDEYARQRAEQMMKSGEYKKGTIGHELTKGRHNMYISYVNIATTQQNDLLAKFTVQQSEPDDQGIERWSVIVFKIDPSSEFLMEKWVAFCRGLGIKADDIDLTMLDEAFKDVFNKEFKGDVEIREYQGREYISVQPISFTGNEIDIKNDIPF